MSQSNAKKYLLTYAFKSYFNYNILILSYIDNKFSYTPL